jgi:hypothetical protein
MTGYTAVTEQLVAKHRDPIMDEGLHAHIWWITTFYPLQPSRDGRALKAALRILLDHLPDAEGVLPWWSGEEIAQHVADLLEGCIGCRVARPAEGFEAMVWL